MSPNADNGDGPAREDDYKRLVRLKSRLLDIENTASAEMSPLMRRDLESGLEEIAGGLIEFIAFAKRYDLAFVAYLIELAAMEVAKEIDEIEPGKR